MGTRLEPEMMAAIVYLNARGRPGHEVIKLVKEQFSVDVTPQLVCHYNPTLNTGRSLAPHLKKLFYSERKRFYEEIKDWAPISQKAFRLQSYQEIHDNAGKNIPVKLTALKEARIEAEGSGQTLTLQGTGKNGAILTENQASNTVTAARVLAALLEGSLMSDQAMIEGDIVDGEMVDTPSNSDGFGIAEDG